MARLAEQKRKTEEVRLAEQKRKTEEVRLAEQKRKAEKAREAEVARLAGEKRRAEEAREADPIDVGGEPINDRTEAIKRRAAEIAAEMAEFEETMRTAIFDLGMRNLGAFRKKVDAAGISEILRETPQIEVHDHDHAYGFRLGKMEYAVFTDWDSGKLCRDVSSEGGTRRPRITDFDHDDALDEMVECLARMLATIEVAALSEARDANVVPLRSGQRLTRRARPRARGLGERRRVAVLAAEVDAAVEEPVSLEPATFEVGSIRELYALVIECLERQEVGLWTARVSRCGFRRRAG